MTAGMIGASDSIGTKNPDNFDSHLNFEINDSPSYLGKQYNLEKTLGVSNEFVIPEYDSLPTFAKFKMDTLNCSQYVRRAAQEYYGQVDSFPQRKAWDMRYASNIVAKFKEKDKYQEIESLREEGTLRPGMILGVYNPKSKYNNVLDETCHKAKYTHVLLYVGKDKDGELLFDHQWDEKILRVNSNWLKKKGLRPVEILDPLGKISSMSIGFNGYENNPKL